MSGVQYFHYECLNMDLFLSCLGIIEIPGFVNEYCLLDLENVQQLLLQISLQIASALFSF